MAARTGPIFFSQESWKHGALRVGVAPPHQRLTATSTKRSDMRLRLRLLWLLLSSLWRARLGVLDESVLDFRVWPNDVDVQKITNDRFVALMDLGRMDIAFRVGLLATMIRRHWAPLVTFVAIRYRYPLKLFARYRLHTRILYWDSDSFYFEQRFERLERVVATGLVCATFLGPDGPVAPATILSAAGQRSTPPEQPSIVARLQQIETEVRQTQRLGDQ